MWLSVEVNVSGGSAVHVLFGARNVYCACAFIYTVLLHVHCVAVYF